MGMEGMETRHGAVFVIALPSMSGSPWEEFVDELGYYDAHGGTISSINDGGKKRDDIQLVVEMIEQRNGYFQICVEHVDDQGIYSNREQPFGIVGDG